MGIEEAYDKVKTQRQVRELDEQEQAVYVHLEFEPKPGARVAAARVIVAAEEYLEDNEDGTISLHAARLAALRFAVLQYNQVVSRG